MSFKDLSKKATSPPKSTEVKDPKHEQAAKQSDPAPSHATQAPKKP